MRWSPSCPSTPAAQPGSQGSLTGAPEPGRHVRGWDGMGWPLATRPSWNSRFRPCRTAEGGGADDSGDRHPRVSLDQSCQLVPIAVRTMEGQGDRGTRPPCVGLETQPGGGVCTCTCVGVRSVYVGGAMCCVWVHMGVCWWVRTHVCMPHCGSLTGDRGREGAAGEQAHFSPKLQASLRPPTLEAPLRPC